MNYHLDTCTFVWLNTEPTKIPKRVMQVLREPGNELFLSSVSAWEIVVKYDLGKLPLHKHPSSLIPETREENGFKPLDLTEAAVLQLTKLPKLHKDPFDRILVCQAFRSGSPSSPTILRSLSTPCPPSGKHAGGPAARLYNSVCKPSKRRVS